ncbi:MAG: LptF/LptG family permease [Puniceicoccales bacterium]|jgi:lipopolysaccharide export system permease protein|nr:LptF/LptG family permease [Puniceicoccales bacterium]
MLFQRHIFLQTLQACVLACVFFVGILLIGNATRDLLRLIANEQVTFIFLLKTLLVLIPSVAAYALPLGLVAGILTTVGRMSMRNEFLTLRTSGVSMARAVTPILLLGFLASFFVLAVNLLYAPRAIHFYRKSLRELVFQDPMRFIRPNYFIKDFPGYVLFINGHVDILAAEIHIWGLDGHGRVSSFLRAADGKFFPNADGLLVKLRHGTLEYYGKNELVPLPPIYFRDLILNLPNKVSSRETGWIKPLKHYDLFELLSVLRKSPDDYSGPEFSRERRRMFIAANYVLQQRIASAVAIFILTVIAIPLGIRTKHAENSVGTLIALALVLSYYFSTVVISWGQTNLDLRVDLLAWIPVLVLAVIAILTFGKITARH